MDDAVKVYLVGTTKVVRSDGRPIFLHRKAAAMVAYVALQGRVSRTALAGLLWPSLAEPAARANLRELLCRVHTKVGTWLVGGTGETLELDPSTWVDVLHDLDGVDGRAFLGGHDYADCEPLDAWVRTERDGLRGEQTYRLLEELAGIAAA